MIHVYLYCSDAWKCIPNTLSLRTLCRFIKSCCPREEFLAKTGKKTEDSAMVFARFTLVTGLLFRLAITSPILTIPDSLLPTYDVIVVGGGPAGLSAASALGRVRRSALLIDSGVYRTDLSKPWPVCCMPATDEAFLGNAPTQEVHDVITRDGTVPSEFRALAREQISVYTSVSMMNGTVSSVVPEDNNTYFTITDEDGKQYLSKKVILATGMKDILPDTPGLSAGWGKGIYCTY